MLPGRRRSRPGHLGPTCGNAEPKPHRSPLTHCPARYAHLSLPAELPDLIKHVYTTILMTQVDAQMVAEAANRSLSGELTGTDQFATTIVIASLIEAVDESLSADQTPEALLGPWEDTRSIHDQSLREVTYPSCEVPSAQGDRHEGVRPNADHSVPRTS